MCKYREMHSRLELAIKPIEVKSEVKPLHHYSTILLTVWHPWKEWSRIYVSERDSETLIRGPSNPAYKLSEPYITLV